jgi:molybdopterin-guanine dinucleotide biosynthesis protein A
MKATKPKIFGLILAGGYSRRMGRDKALLAFHGKPQIEYVYDLLEEHCSRIFVSKRKDQELNAINGRTYNFINDSAEFSNQGPLGGILSAMKEHPGAVWLIIACDLPFITKETIQTLIDNRDPQKTATAFISSSDGLPEPLCAIWEGQAYGPILTLFNEGVHCPRKVLIKSNTRLIPQINPHWLDNINTPEEYSQFKI